jgi:EF hand
MKITTKLMLFAATAGASALLFAQEGPPGDGGPHDRPGPGAPGGPNRRMPGPPPVALIGALDANHDGVIDADEIANAVEALKKLDKNNDGKLTPDEFIGPRPDGPGQRGLGGQPGPDGPRGPRGRGPDGQNGPNDRPPRPPGE